MAKKWQERADEASFVWLSVSPRWAALITSGQKTVEWRKSAPELAPGTPFLLYSSAPDKSVIGAGEISGVSRGPWRELADRLGSRGAATQEELKAYFESGGSERSARAIELASFKAFAKPLPLARLKALALGFSPPVAPQLIEGDKALRLSQAILALGWSGRAPKIALSWVGEGELSPELSAYFERKGEQLEASYPGAREWMRKTLSELAMRPEGDRGVLIARDSEGAIAGYAVIKKSEGKIASLRVEEGFRAGSGGGGLGPKMFGACCERLGEARPYWTAAPEIWPQLRPLAERMSWPAREADGGWVVGAPPEPAPRPQGPR